MTTEDQPLDLLDAFIGEHLPPWLAAASPAQIAALKAVHAAQRASETLLTREFAALQEPHAFARRVLEDAILRETGVHLDLTRALWRHRWQNSSLMGGEALVVHHSFEPALAHLMQNFAENERFDSHTGLIHREPGHPLDAAPLLIDSARLARICRQVDVGTQYLGRLDGILDGAVSLEWREEKRQRLALAVELADLQGRLQPADVAMLRQALAGQPLSHAECARVQVQHLKVLGCTLSMAILFELRGTPAGVAPAKADHCAGLILYLAHRPLQRFESWAELERHLQTLLQDERQRAPVLGLISLAQRPTLLGLLRVRLSDPVPDLEVHGEPLRTELFTALTRLHIAQLRADSSYLLVSTAQADEKARQARLDTLESVGSNLLQLAALFVPGLNELMMGQMVVQTLHEVYEGASDWLRGHQHEALEHLFAVAEVVAVNALAAGAGALPNRLVRGAFLEQMAPVSTSSGPRLWSPALEPYRDAAPPKGLVQGAEGLFHRAGRRWWRHQQHFYRLSHDSEVGQWRLQRSDGREGFAPALQWNGEYGWRLSWQRPQLWNTAQALLEHLWPLAADLDADRCQQILRIADVDDAALHDQVVQQGRLPVTLRDTLQRFALDERIERFFTGLSAATPVDDPALLDLCLEQLPLPDRLPARRGQAIALRDRELRAYLMDRLSSQHLSKDPLMALVLRDFPSLPDVYALEVVDRATSEQRQHMATRLALPLAVAEQARRLEVQGRVCRMLQGLYLHNAYSDHLPRLVFSLLLQFAQWPRSVNFEVRRESFRGRLYLRLYQPDAANPPRILVDHEGELQVYEAGRRLFTGAEAAPRGLLAIMLHFLPEADRLRLGWNGVGGEARMRADLQRRLPADRKALLAMLAIDAQPRAFRPPQRLLGGRFGYLLSGRGEPGLLAERTLQDRVRSLYPGFDPQQLQSYLGWLEQQPGSPFAALLRAEQRFEALNLALETWIDAGTLAAHQAARRRVADELRRCWRRQGLPGRPQPDGEPGMMLDLSGIAVRELPALPSDADFAHISEVRLDDMQLHDAPHTFLQPFSHVQHLSLERNALTHVPPALAHFTQLDQLLLGANRLVLGAADQDLIGSLRLLRVLNLSGNALHDLELPLDRLPRLRQLGLRETGLTRMPARVQLAPSLEFVDLRDNAISQLPDDLADTRLSLRRGLALEGNPLPADYAQRWLHVQSHASRVPSPQNEPQLMSRWFEGLSDSDRVIRTIQWGRLREERGSNDFFHLLQDVLETSDFRSARHHLQTRLWRLFETIEADSDLRQEVFSLASQPRTCVDSVISLFAQLEVFSLAGAAAPGGVGSEAGLLNLARRLFRLEQVEMHVRSVIQRRRAAGEAVDEVEVSLAYRVGLAEALDLPGQPSSLQFTLIADVSDADLAMAEVQVRQADASDALVSYISERDFWLRYLRAHHAQTFDQIEAPFWTRMDALDSARDSLGDEVYRSQVQAVALERETAVNTEARRLTRLALARVQN
ncbi:hypothetical protein IAE35_13660 [Pseudomonas sp. S75]|uniref:NEL-type E3 ubiquitin ligase domain-containing protein n=1 Tax=unclassified Pseudomonas TaxID=196821 RepID=UPI001904980E|nr:MULTISPECIES: NEL-type E3 ubiquitin ligase domain-containing protein [unclassified Pseudomonas]MBJ9976574.1 hypothetical protein [Pseudomonas sp. S30]MBK0154390.1 hypothetical protein [Pseudomonas sp. S75]